MLIEFTVGNFRSIAEKVTLSMIAAAIKSGPHATRVDENNVIYVNDKLSLLKSAAIYGANASGKSNILNALTTMGTFIDTSVHNVASGSFPYTPFLLIDGYQDRASHFEIIFLMQGLQYRYGFELSKARVEKEWLYYVPSTREARIFEREGQDIDCPNFTGAGRLKSLVAPQALFLTVARDFNVLQAKNVFQWLNRFPVMSGLDDNPSYYTIQCLEEKILDGEIVDFISRLDVGISGIEVSVLPSRDDDENIGGNKVRQKSYKVETVHTAFDKQGNPTSSVKLNMRHHESEGTRRLFSMSGMIVQVLKNGSILAVDEMDARLHPALTRKIVELFHAKETNPKDAQLIFATHDTNLLDNRLFRRDQIWFTEKDRMGATDLYSLAELKVRNDGWGERGYIEGRYGAIPFPGNFEGIFNRSEVSHAGEK